MTAEEIADARTVFADKLDYSKIFFASESLANDIVFGVQDFVTGNPESRAFVSNNLVNFDVDEGIKRHTMIHELTHVWQAEFTGPVLHVRGDPRPGPAAPATTTATTRSVGSTSIPIDYAGGTEFVDDGSALGEGGQDDLDGRRRRLRRLQPRAAGPDPDALLRAQGAARPAAGRLGALAAVRRLRPGRLTDSPDRPSDRRAIVGADRRRRRLAPLRRAYAPTRDR